MDSWARMLCGLWHPVAGCGILRSPSPALRQQGLKRKGYGQLWFNYGFITISRYVSIVFHCDFTASKKPFRAFLDDVRTKATPA